MAVFTTGIRELADAILEGDGNRAVDIASDLIDKGISIEYLIHYGLSDALRSLDTKCTTEEFNLLEIMLAGRAVMKVMDEVVVTSLEISISNKAPLGKTLVLGTIQGDIHELGKHVVRTVFMANGFRVIDLGKDVPPHSFVSTAQREGADFIGVSSLITLTYPEVRKIRTLLCDMGMEGVKVMAGGAALQQATPDDLNVDFVARDVFDGLHYVMDES